MKILVEGCDLVGKSLLCKILQDKYKLDYIHYTKDDPKDFEFYKQSLRKDNIIIDRNYISESIYYKIFNRSQSLTIKEIESLNTYAKENNVKIIILTCSNDELLKRLKARGENEKEVRNNLFAINQAFIEFAHNYNISLIDTTQTNFQDIFNLIEGNGK